ncbi:hypothetical protein SODALDRAFT_325283 [Sodiomyces alkalinus F11]|uniref:Uncharacterized protein n=1 Tax=Sodiomyces alkalinus (strain CBS 110278 / VKM F-3762 / F11) TaxID=1314773 RepID=A0A3N2PTD4_SODAK|nr:hypothetical protein SODALDRAFT_325283 [Sodiomyces alkalinus F11]ROT37748.1 hypothetical protein SODALDRAFT_325283 [Sodiomyces alkalinus F11]
MAPSVTSLALAALAFVGDVRATKYTLEDTYNHLNFFDKFNFFESRYGTGDYNDVDPTWGYINYRNRADAEALGLIATVGEEVYLGVDHMSITEYPGMGRSSVRVESKATYNKGLFIARLRYMACLTVNTPVIHTGRASENGTCYLGNEGQTSTVTHANCDNFGGLWDNHGCTTEATQADPWGSSNGGVYALWGTPSVLVANDLCNIDGHFADQRLSLNINFCGAAGLSHIWGESCSGKTQEEVCSNYVANNPYDFADVYWLIQDIRVFAQAPPAEPSSSSAVPSSAFPSSDISSSIVSSSDVPVSAIPSSSEPPIVMPSPTFPPSNVSVSATETSAPASEITVDVPSSSKVPTLTFPTFHFTNSSAPEPPATSNVVPAPTTTPDVVLPPTTRFIPSTVYTTRIITVTSCPPTVPDCPGTGPGNPGYVVTETVPLYTTVCPVVVSTRTIKRIHSVTSCPPSVPTTACPYGSITTETLTTTITRVLDGGLPVPTTVDTVSIPSPSALAGHDDHDDHEGDKGEHPVDGERPDEGDHGDVGHGPTTTVYSEETATIIPVPVDTPGPAPPHNNFTVPSIPAPGGAVESGLPEFSGAVRQGASFGAGFALLFVAGLLL